MKSYKNLQKNLRKMAILLCVIAFAQVQVHQVFAQEVALLDSAALVQKKEFTSLEEALKNPALVVRLDLSYGGLSDFPMELLQFPNLQSLNLSNNGMMAIPSDIAKLTKLQRLNLATNGLKRLPAELASLKHLKWLDVTQNQFLSSELTKLRSALPLASISD
jgi:Leucine-rich repeat (LRR) protein